MDIGKRLKELRKERGLTQKEMAARVDGGLDYTYIGKIERGEQLPSLKMLTKFAEALSAPLQYFLGEDGNNLYLLRLSLDERGQELLKVLQSLHRDDLPLITEIARALIRHRKGQQSDSEYDDLPLAAEENGTYYPHSIKKR